MQKKPTVAPDSSAVRVALWRALHVEVDASPHVINDTIGLELVAPHDNWRSRPDMDAEGTRGFRAGIVARARFVDDLITEQAALGVTQYLILGAGLDTFAQRRPEIASRIRIFEIDQPETQAWKRERLIDLGFGIPDWLRLVPVDFEAGDDWWDRLADDAGFDANLPTVVACTGVTMYLTRDAVAATLRRLTTLAPGSTLAMTFLLPAELTQGEERQQHKEVQKNARDSGTPFLSFFTPPEMLATARDAGFASVAHVSAADLAQRYFAGRTDGLRPSSGESFLIATT